MGKRRISLRLSDDEVAVVGPVGRWMHLIQVYEAFANDPKYDFAKEEWLDAAAWIREWVDRGLPSREDDE